MFSSERKTVGVFFNRTGCLFEDTVYRVVLEQGKKCDVNVLIFSTLGYRNSTNYYDELERETFDFAPVEKLNGLIIAPDTYEMEGSQEQLYHMIKTRVTCPVVAIRDHNAPYDRVHTDEENAIRPLLRHLMEDHGYKRIHFLAGFHGHPDGEIRLKCYYDEMAKHNLPLPTNAVHYGTMWRTGGDVACDYFFQDGLPVPEAIVCANDYMAQSVMEELQKRGYRVPEDVCVTGFDNVEDQVAVSCSMTTVEQDYAGIVEKAFSLLIERMEEQQRGVVAELNQDVGIPAKLILRHSCGCAGAEDRDDLRARLRSISQQVQGFHTRETCQMYFSIDMNAAKTREEMHTTFMRKRLDVPEMRDFYLLCFENKPGVGETEGYAEALTDYASLVTCMRNHEDLGMPMESIRRDQLLPDWVWDCDEPQSFFVRLLHQRDSIYGYCVIRYDEGHIPSLFFQQWTATISSALRHLFNQQKLQRLYEERRKSSITDPLTGLYNRRGLEEIVIRTWDVHCRAGEPVTVLTFDMDNLKPINDTYGHSAGDDALRTIASVLRRMDWAGAVSARTGGDEFLLFLPRCDEAGAHRAIAAIESELAQLNQENGAKYEVAMSIGWFTTIPTLSITLARCIRESDQRMYAVKHTKKLQR